MNIFNLIKDIISAIPNNLNMMIYIIIRRIMKTYCHKGGQGEDQTIMRNIIKLKLKSKLSYNWIRTFECRYRIQSLKTL